MPLRDVVVYPHMVIPLFVGRKQSIKALEAAMAAVINKFFWLRKKMQPKIILLKKIFIKLVRLSTVLQLLKLPDGTVKVLVEGVKRGQS